MKRTNSSSPPTSQESFSPGETVPFVGEAQLTPASGRVWATIAPYLQIARPDHWFKNVFMLAGVVLAYFYEMTPFAAEQLRAIPVVLLATCLIASSNYVINEILDAPHDQGHPSKAR